MVDISLTALAICLLPTLGIIWLSHKWSGKGLEVSYATLRMLFQLMAVGFVLVFIFAADNPLVGGLVVFVMIAVSSLIGIRTVARNRLAAFWKATIGIGLGGGAILLFVLFAVLQLADPWYDPRIIIPLAGMVFSNSMTAVTLAAERFESEYTSAVSYQVARTTAWKTALIPQINSHLAVGLVALPGMMTGQILSGVDPLIAVRYQIIVMAMLLQSSGYAVALYLWLLRPQEH